MNPLALEEFAALEERHRLPGRPLGGASRTRARTCATSSARWTSTWRSLARRPTGTPPAVRVRVRHALPRGRGTAAAHGPGRPAQLRRGGGSAPRGKEDQAALPALRRRALAEPPWALLVAIFKARPSPFYVMDEVEAALDDRDLGRLLTIFSSSRKARS
ncbi:hypothetical protein QJS66_00990 [Kocuria rhizophila]|nr:hypothetical protein QJS66_00990 [Kocuria rhizophila]